MQAVAFHPDGLHLLGGGDYGIRRWRLSDGQEVGKQTGMKLRAISVSREGKWIVCGTDDSGTSVWDAEMHEKIIEVESTNSVSAVDVSPDSTRFATGTPSPHRKASIWSMTSGERLVGPLIHDSLVAGIRFSPDGEQIATAGHGSSVRIFDSHNGNQLIEVNIIIRSTWPITPLAWSNDGQQIFTVSDDHKIKSFAVSTGSALTESPVLEYPFSLSLAGNGKFIATVARDCISFLNTSTLVEIGTAINGEGPKWSTPISLDNSQVATGRADGKIDIYNLANFLPDSYGPFHVSICPFFALASCMSTIPSPILTHHISYLLARNKNQTRRLWPLVAMTTNHVNPSQ